ncbi:MAG: ribonuclease HI family protein [Pseudomonadota bacterium]
MTDFARLSTAAYKSELVASRLLSRRTGCSPEAALRSTMQAAAGAFPLAELVAAREAALAAAVARAELRDALRAAALAKRQARHDGKPTPWRAWFDGSAHPNPGDCGIGAVLQGPGDERVEISRAAGYGNSSEAEYRALVALLEAAVARGAHGLTIYGDSKVVIDDVNGPDATAAASLQPCRHTALGLIAQLRGVTLRWIPRHKNSAADALSQRAVRIPHISSENTLDQS